MASDEMRPTQHADKAMLVSTKRSNHKRYELHWLISTKLHMPNFCDTSLDFAGLSKDEFTSLTMDISTDKTDRTQLSSCFDGIWFKAEYTVLVLFMFNTTSQIH